MQISFGYFKFPILHLTLNRKSTKNFIDGCGCAQYRVSSGQINQLLMSKAEVNEVSTKYDIHKFSSKCLICNQFSLECTARQ